MNVDNLPNVDEMFSEDLDARIAQVLQKAFMIGVLVGRNQIQDDMSMTGSPLSQSVGQLIQQLDKLVPNVGTANQMMNPLQKTEEMASLDFSKAFKTNLAKSQKNRDKQQKHLNPDYKRLEAQHDVIVKGMVDAMASDQKSAVAQIVQEVNRHKPKK